MGSLTHENHLILKSFSQRTHIYKKVVKPLVKTSGSGPSNNRWYLQKCTAAFHADGGYRWDI